MADPRLKGADVRYGARTIKIEVFVNTDASKEEVERRALSVQSAARGMSNDMVVTMVGEVPRDESEHLWAQVIATAREHVGEKKS